MEEIGPSDRLVPDMVRSIMKDEDIILRNPNGIRPWQYILDVLSGYMNLSERLYKDPKSYSEAWNFGPTYRKFTTASNFADHF